MREPEKAVHMTDASDESNNMLHEREGPLARPDDAMHHFFKMDLKSYC